MGYLVIYRMGEQMAVKEEIDNRIIELMEKPNCAVQRAVLVLFELDPRQEDIIGWLKKTNVWIDFEGFMEKEEVIPLLIKKLLKYEKKKINKEIFCPLGLYVLLGVNHLEEWNMEDYHKISESIKRYFDKQQIEFFSFGKVGERDILKSDNLIEERVRIWIIDPQYAVSSLQILLNDACFSEICLNEIIRKESKEKSGLLILRTEECNAIRQGLCVSFLRALRKQTQGRKKIEIENDIKSYLYSSKYEEYMLERVPKSDYFPFPGYEKLVEEITRTKLGVIERLKKLLKNEPIRSSLSVYKALNMLLNLSSQGVSNKSAEILDCIKLDVIPRLCRECLNHFENEIKNVIFKRFSLYEIVYEVSECLQNYQQIEEHFLENDEEIMRELLNDSFMYSDTSIKGIYEGLEMYFRAFDGFITRYIKYMWWEALNEFLANMKTSVEKQLQELNNEEIVFLESLIERSENLLLKEDAIIYVNILGGKDLHGKIKYYSRKVRINEDDVMKLIKAKDYAFFCTSDYNGQSFPMIFTMIPKKLNIEDSVWEKARNGFKFGTEWKHPLNKNYIASSAVYIIRVYSINNKST